MTPGHLHLLQSQPSNTAPAAVEPTPIDQPKSAAATSAGLATPAGEWLAFMPMLENFATPLTPLSEDFAKAVLPDAARFIEGRIYLDFTRLRRLLPIVANDAELSRALRLKGLPELRIDTLKFLRWFGLWLVTSPWIIQFGLRSARLSKQQRARFCDYAQSLSDGQKLDARALLIRLVRGRHLFEHPTRLPFLLNASAGRYFLVQAVLNRLVRRWARKPLQPQTLLRLYTCNTQTTSQEMAVAIAELGSSVAALPRLAEAFAKPISLVQLNALASAQADKAFLDRYGTFLEFFGHRGMNELELADKRWVEDPLPLLSYIAARSKKPGPLNDSYGLQLAARDDLHQAIAKRWQRRIVDHLLQRIRYYVALREDARFSCSQALFLVRKKLLRLQDRLMSEEKLTGTDDLFFLNWAQIAALDAGTLNTSEANEIIARARERHKKNSHAPVRWEIGFDTNHHPTGGPEQQSLSVVQGHCVAPGDAEGVVRIVLQDADIANVVPGEILVSRFADPRLALVAAGAVICEHGSFLSQLANLAREFGVPCIIAAEKCTAMLRNGDSVRIEGDSGRIFVQDPATQADEATA
jgi:phosphohistidine swiveling domain-containing protein